MPRPPIATLKDLALSRHAHGAAFEALSAAVAAPLGASRLGARYVELPAGKKAWPFHAHHANDEIFVILAGSGVLRFGDGAWPVAAGDVVVCPSGGAETAHQLSAGDAAPLCFLAVSTMNEPDVLEYPDSGKLTVFAGAAPGGDKSARRVELTVHAGSGIGYWDGEA